MARDAPRPLDAPRLATLSHEGRGEKAAAARDDTRTRSSPTIAVARIGAPHGVRGEVRLHPFTEDPASLRTLGPFEAGTRTLALEAMRPQGDHFVARFAGVADRDAAHMLRNMTLFVPRERLPAIGEADTFYVADLVGLAVRLPDGTAAGRIEAVHNFGAGDILEVRPAAGGASVLVPFTAAAVPTVDIAGDRVMIASADLLAPTPPRNPRR